MRYKRTERIKSWGCESSRKALRLQKAPHLTPSPLSEWLVASIVIRSAAAACFEADGMKRQLVVGSNEHVKAVTSLCCAAANLIDHHIIFCRAITRGSW